MILALDIGGTMVKYGVFEGGKGAHTCVEEGAFPANAQLGAHALIETLCAHSEVMKQRYALHGVAVSSAGQIDSKRGEVLFATESIPGYTGTPLKSLLQQRLHLPVSVENDVNCFLLGAVFLDGYEGDALAITLGTGIGGALRIGGHLYTGSGFSAGEIGHMTLYPKGLPCTCGGKGCFEQYASTQALKKLVCSELGTIDLVDFFQKCKTDAEAERILDAWVDDLTEGLRGIIHLLNPRHVLIGGAVAAQGTYLEDKIKECLNAKLMPAFSRDLEVHVCAQGNKAVLYGAWVHFLEETHERI